VKRHRERVDRPRYPQEISAVMRALSVSVNCAAIPASLIAVGVFGHEKGAFTGQTQRRLDGFRGWRKKALSSLMKSVSCLQNSNHAIACLQEREFERVGGNQTIRANVRVIAATNRDLEACVAARVHFAAICFTALNVFPMRFSSAGKREDIPLSWILHPSLSHERQESTSWE